MALREYSYAPTGCPTRVCAKVVEREIYSREANKSVKDPLSNFINSQGRQAEEEELTLSITAPVTASCGDPAWTANVPNLWVGVAGRGGVSIGSSKMAMASAGNWGLSAQRTEQGGGWKWIVLAGDGPKGIEGIYISLSGDDDCYIAMPQQQQGWPFAIFPSSSALQVSGKAYTNSGVTSSPGNLLI